MSSGTPRGPKSRHRASTLVALDVVQYVTFDIVLTVGRHPQNDLVVDEPRISSRHATIEWIGPHWRIRDLGSRNGTSLNQRRIHAPKTIREGDVIRFAGISGWRVEELGVPRDVDDLKETAAGREGAEDLRLHLSFVGPDQGTVRVVHGDHEWSVITGQRFILLYRLARDTGRWVSDDDLKVSLWGRSGLYEMDPSSLHKLIHDTRRMFEQHGIGGWVIEKHQGKTRLVLPAQWVHIVDEAGTKG